MKKRVELKDYLDYDIELQRYQCFNEDLERIYYNALDNGIILTYNNQDLLKFINESKDSLLNIPDTKNATEQFEKSENRKFIAKCIIRTMLTLSLFFGHIAGKDHVIHEEQNAINSYLILNNLTTDINEDGILEIKSDDIIKKDIYREPTEEIYYKNTNLLYDLFDEITLSDSESFKRVMEYLGYDLIEFDNEIYSLTGYVTRIEYIIEDEYQIEYTSKNFKSREETEEYMKEINKEKEIYIIDYHMEEVRNIEELPKLIKSKKEKSLKLI